MSGRALLPPTTTSFALTAFLLLYPLGEQLTPELREGSILNPPCHRVPQLILDPSFEFRFNPNEDRFAQLFPAPACT